MWGTRKKDDVVTEVLAGAEVKKCTKCGRLSSVPFDSFDEYLWFCFECGHEEVRAPHNVRPA